MEVLASFSTVRLEAAAPAPGDSASCVIQAAEPLPPRLERPASFPRRRRITVPSWSITILAVISTATWAAVWWIEHRHDGTRQPAALADVDGATHDSVTR